MRPLPKSRPGREKGGENPVILMELDFSRAGKKRDFLRNSPPSSWWDGEKPEWDGADPNGIRGKENLGSQIPLGKVWICFGGFFSHLSMKNAGSFPEQFQRLGCPQGGGSVTHMCPLSPLS